MDQLPSKKLNRYEKVFSALLHAEFRSHSPRNSGSSLMTSRRRREHTKKWQIQVEEKKRMTKCKRLNGLVREEMDQVPN